ncbi:MAG: hypothetical protein NTW04_02310, partial [Elusimicrobia bacterium]|nr:hypothetical protein [Elusimicrobiota bacterium]
MNFTGGGIQKDFAIMSAIAAATLIIFSPCFSASFTNWDDGFYVIHNQQVIAFSLKEIFSSFTLCLYHPLTILSYAVEHFLFGLNPAIYHATNVLLHILNCLLVWRVCAALFEKNTAIATAVLFLLHP